MKICHIADIHIRGLTRHNEYNSVFKKLVKSIKNENVDHVFIAGDIFHTKTSGITPEYITLVTNFFINLSRYAYVHMMLGNHDCNLSNSTRLDAISPIVDAINSRKIILYKDSGVYNFSEKFTFCVFSPTDQDNWKNVKPTKNHFNIACFHGPVIGCTNDDGFVINANVGLDLFEKFDLTLLGDIHKYQYLNNNIAYPGSLIQQDFGESVDNHGYILWDIDEASKKVSSKFFSISNEYAHKTINYDKNTFDAEIKKLNKKNKVRVLFNSDVTQYDLKFASDELYKNEINDFIFKQASHKKFIDEYEVANLTINRSKLSDPETICSAIESFYEVEFDETKKQIINKKLKNYIDKVDIHPTILNNWTIDELKFNNLYTYRDSNIIDFSNLSGVIGLFGPNKVGKSSILGTILFGLHNTTDRGSFKNVNIINNRKQQGDVEITFSGDGRKFKIKRETIKTKNKKGVDVGTTSLSFDEIKFDNTIVKLDGEQRIETDKIIQEKIGTFEDFTLTSIATQDDLSKFIKEGSTSRKQILTRFLQLDLFDDIYRCVKEDINELKAKIKTYKILNDNDYEETLLQEKQTLSNTEKLINLLNTEIEEQTSKYMTLKITADSNIEYDEFKKLFETKTKYLSTKNEIENKILGIKTKILEIDSKNIKISKKLVSLDEDNLNGIITTIDELKQSISTLKSSFKNENFLLEQKTKSLLLLSDIPCGTSYPSCKFIKGSVESVKDIDTQQELVNDIQVSIENLSKTILEHNELETSQKLNTIKKAKDFLVISENENLKNKQDLLSFENNLMNITNLLNDVNKQLKNYKSYDDVEKMQEEYKLVKNELKNNKIIYQKELLNQANQKIKIDQMCKDYKDLKKINTEFEILEILQKSFSKKGISNFLIKARLSEINDKLSEILDGIVNFNIHLELSEDLSLDVFLTDSGSKRYIELGSGMEKVISSLAIRVALREISEMPKTDFLHFFCYFDI